MSRAPTLTGRGFVMSGGVMPTARSRDQIEADLDVLTTRTLDDLLDEWLDAEVLRPSQVLAQR